jgi:poly(A) polymerase
MAPGKPMGDVLRTLETEWIESGFRLDRDALLERAADLASKSS